MSMRVDIPPIAILAGGFASRMQPVAATIPKSLIPIGGEPFIAHQLRLLRREGVSTTVLCLHHLGEQVRRFVGDGSQFGLDVRYSYDGDRPLGTGGALRKAVPLLGDVFMVLYGDSYLDIPFAPVVDAFKRAGTPGLITVYRNEGRFDDSNIVFAEGRVQAYSKKRRLADMHFIDYGLACLRATAFDGFAGQIAFDLGEVYSRLADTRRLGGFEIHNRFYEIGSPEGLSETTRYLTERP